MKQPLRLALVTFATFAAFASLAPAAVAQKEPPPACVKSWGEAWPAGVGYNHVVIIENACARPAACVITTDVAPEPIQATVAAKDRAELVTFRGSPSRVFTPRVACKLQ